MRAHAILRGEEPPLFDVPAAATVASGGANSSRSWAPSGVVRQIREELKIVEIRLERHAATAAAHQGNAIQAIVPLANTVRLGDASIAEGANEQATAEKTKLSDLIAQRFDLRSRLRAALIGGGAAAARGAASASSSDASAVSSSAATSGGTLGAGVGKDAAASAASAICSDDEEAGIEEDEEIDFDADEVEEEESDAGSDFGEFQEMPEPD